MYLKKSDYQYHLYLYISCYRDHSKKMPRKKHYLKMTDV